MTLIAMLALADPVAISVGSQIKFVKTPSGWTQPGKSMDGKELSWLKLGSKDAPRKYKVEWSEGPPMENTQFVTSEVVTEDEVFVSGGKFKEVKTIRLSPKNATYLKIATEYAKKKGSKATNIVIQDIVSGDFNRDGQTDVLISIGTGSTSETLKKGDFSAAFLRTQIGKTVKTVDLNWETNFGQMRGPYHIKFVGAGDFDGDGVTEFVTTIVDSWGIESRLLQLSKAGKVKQLCLNAFGE